MTKPYLAPIHTAVEGAELIADGGFTCLADGEVCRVRKDDHGLYVPCAGSHEGEDYGKPATADRTEKHYLDGQLDDDELNYVGFLNLSHDAAF